MNETLITIAAQEGRAACKGEPNLDQRVIKAMRACRNHWMVTDEEQQFRAALVAAILESEGEERSRIERSAKALNRIGAMLQALQAGVPVDLAAMADEKQDDDLLPLRKMWDESKQAA